MHCSVLDKIFFIVYPIVHTDYFWAYRLAQPHLSEVRRVRLYKVGGRMSLESEERSEEVLRQDRPRERGARQPQQPREVHLEPLRQARRQDGGVRGSAARRQAGQRGQDHARRAEADHAPHHRHLLGHGQSDPTGREQGPLGGHRPPQRQDRHHRHGHRRPLGLEPGHLSQRAGAQDHR